MSSKTTVMIVGNKRIFWTGNSSFWCQLMSNYHHFLGGWWFEGFGLSKTTWKEKKYCWNSSPEQPSRRGIKGRQLLLTLSSVPRFAPAFCPYLLCTALSTSRLRRFGHFPSAAFEWYSPRTKSKTIKQRRPCWSSVYF